MSNFDLRLNPWLPCLTHKGISVQLGLRDVLVDAHSLSQLRDQSPLVTASLHRMLLALLHRIYDGPHDLEIWRQIWSAKQFDSKLIDRYFNMPGVLDRFNLFDQSRPFYQVGGFSHAKARPVTRLAIELACGNNATLFDHTIESQKTYWAPDFCARWLVAHQAFALGGGAGVVSNVFGRHPNFTQAPLVGGVTALLCGSTLFKTLMLNFLVLQRQDPLSPSVGDCPAWEREKSIETCGLRKCRGYLDLLTWQSRCVRLIAEGDRVSEMFYAQGETLSDRPIEPGWFYRLGNECTKLPVRLDPQKALWRETKNLFFFSADFQQERRPLTFGQAAAAFRNENIDSRESLHCALLGLSNDQARPICWVHQDFPVPHALLNRLDKLNLLCDVLEVSELAADKLELALKLFTAHMLGNGDMNRTYKPQAFEIAKFVQNLEGYKMFWSSLERPFNDFVNGLESENVQDAPLYEWKQVVGRQAIKAYDAVSERKFKYCARNFKAHLEGRASLLKDIKDIAEYHPLSKTPVIFQNSPGITDDTWLNQCYELIAIFKATYPYKGGEGDFGNSMRKLGPYENSIKRFMAILNSNYDKLSYHLIHSIYLLKSQRVLINWSGLLSDLMQWNATGQPVQRRWALSYWSEIDSLSSQPKTRM